MPTEEVDHMVRIEDGGARFDERNLLGLCKNHHSIKSSLERHHGNLITEMIEIEDGYFVPADKQQIIDLLIEKSL